MNPTEYFREQVKLADQAICDAAKTIRNKDQLTQWIKQNWTVLMRRGVWYAHGDWRTSAHSRLKMDCMRQQDVPELLNICIEGVKFDMFSNMHSAPQGKPINFLMSMDLPKNYPGWEMWLNIECEFNEDWSYAAFCQWDHSLIHTVHGGGTLHGYQRKLILWADDWPAMYEQRQMDLIWTVLNS